MTQAMNYLAAIARHDALDGSPEWQRAILGMVQEAIDVIEERGGDLVASRRSAVEALLQVAAELAVHDIDCILPDGTEKPAATNAALADFAAAARISLLGEVTSHGLPFDPEAAA